MLTALLSLLAMSRLLLPEPASVEWSAFPGDGAVGTNVQHVHDPTIVYVGGRYLCFNTSGNGFGVLRSSKDLLNWTEHGPVMPETPEWLRKRYNHRSLWAPDIVVMGKALRMYYSASMWGTNRSVIGFAECADFDPLQPTRGWVDQGLVIESRPDEEHYNAIDPEVVVTPEGEQWLFFGSYFAGIHVVQLDPATGKPKEGAVPICVARNTGERGNPLEAPAVCLRDGYYYLFVSYGLAGQGVRSTYRIMVGRSKSPQGPFVDRDGKSMVDGGHTNVMKGSPPMMSPGHSDVFRDPNGRWLMPYHFYDARRVWRGDLWGLPTLQVRELVWTEDGWPLPGLPIEAGVKNSSGKLRPGRFVHQADFGEPQSVDFRPDGTFTHPRGRGTWKASGDRLTLTWMREEAPTEPFIDELQVAYGGTYYVGRTQAGLVVRGRRVGSR